MIPRFALLSLTAGAAFATMPKTTPPALPPLPVYDNRVFASADFIYWYAKQEGNDFAATGNSITVPGTTDPNTGLVPSSLSGSGNVYAPRPEMNPGFKVSFGVNLSHGQWELISEYTYLFSDADRSVSSDNLNTGIIPLISYRPNNSILSHATYAATSGATGFVEKAKSHWSLLFQNINLELGRNLELFPWIAIRPHFGLEGAWHEQHLKAQFFVNSTTDVSTVLGNNKASYRQSFWGVGPRVGLDSFWRCWDHFGLFANSSASALWGTFRGRAKSFDTNTIDGYSDVEIASQTNRVNTMSPVVGLELGVQTDWRYHESWRFLAQLGWEGQIWFFQNQHSSAIADTSLILQGLTLKMRFDF